MESPSAWDDGYDSIADGSEAEVRERGSRFVGQAFAVTDADAAGAHVAAIRKRYHDATHHVVAWRIGPPESPQERADDDGEPAGTGGGPMLAVLRHRALFDALVVVTRWFGGTKLGTGGLARAYASAAKAALDAAPPRPVVRLSRLRVTCPFEFLGAIEAELARHGDAVHGTTRTYEDAIPCLVVRVVRSRATPLRARLVDVTAGRASVQIVSEG